MLNNSVHINTCMSFGEREHQVHSWYLVSRFVSSLKRMSLKRFHVYGYMLNIIRVLDLTCRLDALSTNY